MDDRLREIEERAKFAKANSMPFYEAAHQANNVLYLLDALREAREAMKVRELEGQIDRLTLDLHQANEARERAEKAADFWNLRYEQAWHEAHPMKQATTP